MRGFGATGEWSAAARGAPMASRPRFAAGGATGWRGSAVPEVIAAPGRVEAAGDPPKVIEEFAGRAAGREERVSVARMRSPAGWSEPGQRPEFDEYTVVLDGLLRVESEDGAIEVGAGQAV